MSIYLEKIGNYLAIFIILLIGLVWAQFFLGQNSKLDSNDGSKGFSTQPSIKIKANGSIADYHIFGSSQVLTETAMIAGESSLKLSLSGTMSSDDQSSGLAYIANNQGVQKKFRVGDEVFDLATLDEIHSSYVVLKRNGRKEKLMLTEVSRADNRTNNTKSSVKTNNAPSVLNHLKTPQNQNWQELMEKQKFDPNKISSIVGNMKIMTDQAGQIQGVKVSNLAQGNLLTKVGLKANDVITSVNGTKVDASNILTIKKTLEQNPNATVTIKRNGKLQNIQVNLSDL